MGGKWENIKRSKGKLDSARSTVFARISREIIVAARHGGGDPAGNFRLRQAIERAKVSGSPNENITRAIRKGTGEDGEIVIECPPEALEAVTEALPPPRSPSPALTSPWSPPTPSWSRTATSPRSWSSS